MYLEGKYGRKIANAIEVYKTTFSPFVNPKSNKIKILIQLILSYILTPYKNVHSC